MTFIKKCYRLLESTGEWCEIVQAQHNDNPNVARLPDCIIPGLYIGDWRDAVNPHVVSHLKITHILSIINSDDCVQYKRLISRGVELLMICVDDLETTNISSLLTLALDFIHKGRCAGNTLVHCLTGISSSSSFCIGYLLRELGITYDQALTEVQKARPLCKPNKGFEAQLRSFESELRIITFQVHYHTKWGEVMHVVGDCLELGLWNVNEKNRMNWVGDGVWEIKLPLFGKSFQYKYVILNEMSHALQWEERGNRLVRENHRARVCRDTWGII